MKKYNLTKEDRELIKKAKVVSKRKKVSGGVIGEVGCALSTKKRIYTGVSINLCCGIGFCAEHSAVADMVSHSNETEIKTIVALWVDGKKWGILYPCGRCRELMQQINMKNRENTWVIISPKEKVKLKELLPEE